MDRNQHKRRDPNPRLRVNDVYNTSDSVPQTLHISRQKRDRRLKSLRKIRLLEVLDDLIQFREPYEDQPPKIQGWNPITRHRQKKQLQQWVQSRPPSAGITADQLKKIYPERGFWQNIKEGRQRGRDYEAALNRLHPVMTGAEAVPVASLKSPVPTATSYGEVTGELKKQKVGFLARNITAIQTRGLAWTGKNAAFAPLGDKGLIITPRKVHPTFFRHEAGHAKDYAYYGGQQGFKTAYPDYGNPLVSYDKRIASTMLPEHRAWAYAKPRTKKDKQLREDALTTYKTVMALSEKLDRLIQFERGDVFYRRLHPDVISNYFPKSHGMVPPRGSTKSTDFAKLLLSTRYNIRPSTTLGEYNMWKNTIAQKSTIQYPGKPPAIKAA